MTVASGRTSTWRWTAIAALPAIALAAWQAAWPWPFFSDDSFISLRYAERLLAGDGLTWTDGADGLPERVEGYSNLLWVLLNAALGAIGIDLVLAARALGGIATAAALWLLAAALQPNDWRSAAVAALPPVLVASTQTVLVWTLAGLEGPLLLVLLAWGFGGLTRRFAGPFDPRFRPAELLAAGLPFALACWTRPDGPLWALTAGTGLAVMRGRDWSAAVGTAFWFGLPAIATTSAQLVFRGVYYGDWVPNTAHVKAEFDPASLAPGWAYVQRAAIAMPGLAITAAIAALIVIAASRRTRAFALVLLLPMLAWLSYLVAIGGDHFPGRRLLHGLLAPLGLLAGIACAAIPGATARALLAVAVALAAAIPNVRAARTDGQSLEIRSEIWEWRGQRLGRLLQRAFANEQPRIAVDAAGSLPYYSQLPALDMLGLCDRTIATTPLPQWLETMRPEVPKPVGHLRGNGSYVMDQQPDLVLFSNPPGLPLPVFVSACEFEDDPRFLRGYRCVLVAMPERETVAGVHEALLAPLWVRVDGAVGVERRHDRIAVPAWLFGAFQLPGPVQQRHQPPGPDPAAAARRGAHLQQVAAWFGARRLVASPDASGALALRLPAGETAAWNLQVPAGRWTARLEPADSALQLRLNDAAVADLTLATESPVRITLTAASDAAIRASRVVLRRTE